MAGLLSPEEQLALPGTKIVWVGSDATLECMGAVDWTGQCYFRADVKDYYHALVEARPADFSVMRRTL